MKNIPTTAEIAAFKLGVKEAHSALGMTYDNDSGSPRSVAYDWGRNVGEIDATGPRHWMAMMRLAPEMAKILLDCSLALSELSKHPAFADDAPEFNKGGIGYKTNKQVRALLARLEK